MNVLEQQAQGQTCFFFIRFLRFFLSFSLQLDIQRVKRSSNRCNVYFFSSPNQQQPIFSALILFSRLHCTNDTFDMWFVCLAVRALSFVSITAALPIGNHYNADPFLTIERRTHGAAIGCAALFSTAKVVRPDWLHFIKLARDCG